MRKLPAQEFLDEYNLFADVLGKAVDVTGTVVFGGALLSAAAVMIPLFMVVRAVEAVNQRLRLW